jgi:hypothetical protein
MNRTSVSALSAVSSLLILVAASAGAWASLAVLVMRAFHAWS